MKQKPFPIEIEKIIYAENIPVVPDCYMGETISREVTLPLLRKAMNSNKKGQHQTDNLVFLELQMPDRKPGIIEDNSWGNVMRKPTWIAMGIMITVNMLLQQTHRSKQITLNTSIHGRYMCNISMTMQTGK